LEQVFIKNTLWTWHSGGQLRIVRFWLGILVMIPVSDKITGIKKNIAQLLPLLDFKSQVLIFMSLCCNCRLTELLCRYKCSLLICFIDQRHVWLIEMNRLLR
jgi:hypothetical protein